MTEERRFKAEDMRGIVNSADLVVYSLAYPDGLTLEEMEGSGIGWVQRIAKAVREGLVNT